MPATTLDGLSAALLAVLAPGGTPVGTLKSVQNRSTTVPYSGLLPVLFIRPLSNQRRFIAARAKQDNPTFALVYFDATPSEQNTTIAAIESAMYANRESILSAIEANPTLGGGAVIAGLEIDETWNPEGPFSDEMGALYVSFTMHVSVQGGRIVV